MTRIQAPPLITTISERCRVCYTCVRECPAKAIRIEDGRACVINDRCIGCANCVKVCARNAKHVRSSIPIAEALLDSPRRVAAMLAPSFPAEFEGIQTAVLVHALRQLGFDLVTEVAYGADLVAAEYRRLREAAPSRRMIATTCPALVRYVEKYYPGLVPDLAPVVSPMIAMARVLHQLHSPDLGIVFIGPCLAKKEEARDPLVEGEVDACLTFGELRHMLAVRGICFDHTGQDEFDPPTPALGTLFPVSRGMLQAAALPEDLITGDVVAADGRENFTQAIKEFEAQALEVGLLEVLCCNGCIMGAGMTIDAPLFRRRASISRYARQRLRRNQQTPLPTRLTIDLSRRYEADDQRINLPSEERLQDILRHMGKEQPEDELNCGACGYATCREHAVAIAKGLAESEMCLPYIIDRLKSTIHDLEASGDQLASAQAALMQAERLASMGQLAAGIAHEINNPLGIVLLYAHLLLDDMDETMPGRDDLKTIVEEADRCKKIVSGLLNFARRNKLALKRVKLATLIDRCARVVPLPANVRLTTAHLDPNIEIMLDPDQITQVLTNFISNAVGAMSDGGSITITSRREANMVGFDVHDDGAGIPEHHLNKIFEPFFTTKDPMKGTGLGLAVTYGIIKMHRGKINVISNSDPAKAPTGTTFSVRLPLNLQAEESDNESPEDL